MTHGAQRHKGQWLFPSRTGHRGLCLYPFGGLYTMQQVYIMHTYYAPSSCASVNYLDLWSGVPLPVALELLPIQERDDSPEDADAFAQNICSVRVYFTVIWGVSVIAPCS